MTLRIYAGGAYFQDASSPTGWRVARDREKVQSKVRAGDGSSIALLTDAITTVTVAKDAGQTPTVFTSHPLGAGDQRLKTKRNKVNKELTVTARRKAKDRGARNRLVFKAVIDLNP